MYNFENYLYQPFLSLITGLMLIIGVSSLGFFFINFFFKKFVVNDHSFYLNSPLIGSNLLILFLTPIVYLELHNYDLFKGISILLIILSIFIIFKYHKFLINIKFEKKDIFLYLILVLLFLLSISPVTHADSLAYHMLGGVNYLIKGTLLKDLLPLEIKLVGSGELLIAMGLSIGSEQFGGLVQFSSIFTIIYVFTKIKKGKISKLLLLGVITTPVFIFFISSPKPQLMQVVNVLFCSFFIYKIYKKEIPNFFLNYFVYIIIVLLTLNVLVKYSFLLSSSFLGIVLFFVLLHQKKIKLLIFPIVISIIVLIFPKFLFYFKYFNIDFISFAKSHLPVNLSLYNDIHLSLKSISEGSRYLPSWLIFPDSLGRIGQSIGLIVLSFLCFKIEKNKTNLTIFGLVILFILIVLIYGQATSRFIYEGFAVAQLFLLLSKIKNVYFYKILKNYIYLQYSFAIILLIYSIFNLTPGAFSQKIRSEIMKENANGYEAMNWVNENLSKNEQIFTSHRSTGLLDNKSYSLIFLNYLDKEDEDFLSYVNFLKKNNVRKAFIYEGFELSLFKDCLKNKVSTINDIFIDFGRNPFKEKFKRAAHIYEVDLENLEKCIS